MILLQSEQTAMCTTLKNLKIKLFWLLIQALNVSLHLNVSEKEERDIVFREKSLLSMYFHIVKELQELHEKYHEKGLVILGCEWLGELYNTIGKT